MPLLRNDPELLQAFRAGSTDALAVVYRHYFRAIDGYLRALARRGGAREPLQPSAVQDLVQDTFIRAFSSAARGGYDGTRDFWPYLKSIARNSFLDSLRRNRSEFPTPDPTAFLVEQLAVQDSGYDPLVMATLEIYLRDLPVPLKGVYERRFVLGMSQLSACAELGVSRRSLRTLEDHLRRGLRRSLLRAGLLPERSRSSRSVRQHGARAEHALLRVRRGLALE